MKIESPENTRWGLLRLYSIAAACLIILAIIGLAGHNSHKKSEESTRKIVHSLKILNYLSELDTMIKEMALNSRGFVITSQSQYESNFHHIKTEIDAKILKLQQLATTKHNNLLILQTLIQNQHQYLLTNIELMKTNSKEMVFNRVKSGQGQELITGVSDRIDELKDVENSILETRFQVDNKNSYSTSLLILIGSLVTSFIVLLALYMVKRELQHRIKAQNKYFESAQIQNAMLQSAGSALIAADKSGKIEMFNSAAEKLLGYKQKDILGKDPSLFHDKREIISFSEDLSRRFKTNVEPGFGTFTFLADRNLSETHKWTYIRRDGSRVPVNLMVTALKNSNNETSGYIGIAYDISKQIEYEETLIKASEEAMAGNKAKSDFLANMSHEIRTPMNAIMGMAELLKETNLTEEQNKFVDIFRRSGEGLLSLINDILDLSKIEAGHFELDKSPFKLSDVVKKSIEVVSLKAHRKHLELAVDMHDSLEDNLLGDGQRLQQILINLLGNAIKFTKQGEVLLKIYPGETDEEKYGIIIEVKDTGIGMNGEQLSKLFQRFTQADSSVTKEFGGTGLGLNITKRISELMDGTVGVESKLGVGSTFRVQLYVEKDKTTDKGVTRIEMNNLRILVVDDTKTNRLILRKIIEGQHAIFFEAEGGDQALQIIEEQHLKNEPFDLVLLDCRMPKIDGFDVASAIQKKYPTESPLLMMLTSDSRSGDLAKSRRLGLKSYLIKPILKQDLIDAMAKVLNHKHDNHPAPKAQDEIEELRPLRLLLVDDNEDNRLIIKAFLKKLPWSIDEAVNGQEGLNLYIDHKYDIILMDMQMPVMDGYTATEEIRKHEMTHELPSTPILALTAYALTEEVDKSILAGCNGHLTKPISKVVLIDAIKTFTEEVIVIAPKELEDIVPGYIAGRKKEIEELHQAFSDKDIKKIQAIGHKLLGSAGSYGFPYLSEIGKRLEDGARIDNRIEIEKAIYDYQLYLSKLKISYE